MNPTTPEQDIQRLLTTFGDLAHALPWIALAVAVVGLLVVAVRSLR